MQNIITKGLGSRNSILTKGYAVFELVRREVIRFVSAITKQFKLISKLNG